MAENDQDITYYTVSWDLNSAQQFLKQYDVLGQSDDLRHWSGEGAEKKCSSSYSSSARKSRRWPWASCTTCPCCVSSGGNMLMLAWKICIWSTEPVQHCQPRRSPHLLKRLPSKTFMQESWLLKSHKYFQVFRRRKTKNAFLREKSMTSTSQRKLEIYEKYSIQRFLSESTKSCAERKTPLFQRSM